MLVPRTTRRPREATVLYRGLRYTLDLVRCRRALVDKQVQGALDSMQSIAKSKGISRSTVSRFFSGRPTSLAVTLKILNALGLTFEQVATPLPIDEEDPSMPPSGTMRTIGSAGRRTALTNQ